MQEIGVIRKMDKLGRVVLPAHIRKELNWEQDTPLEIFADGRGTVLFHGNEYPPAGGAPGDGNGDRDRSGEMADSHCGRRSAGFYSAGHCAAGARH